MKSKYLPQHSVKLNRVYSKHTILYVSPYVNSIEARKILELGYHLKGGITRIRRNKLSVKNEKA